MSRPWRSQFQDKFGSRPARYHRQEISRSQSLQFIRTTVSSWPGVGAVQLGTNGTFMNPFTEDLTYAPVDLNELYSLMETLESQSLTTDQQPTMEEATEDFFNPFARHDDDEDPDDIPGSDPRYGFRMPEGWGEDDQSDESVDLGVTGRFIPVLSRNHEIFESTGVQTLYPSHTEPAPGTHDYTVSLQYVYNTSGAHDTTTYPVYNVRLTQAQARVMDRRRGTSTSEERRALMKAVLDESDYERPEESERVLVDGWTMYGRNDNSFTSTDELDKQVRATRSRAERQQSKYTVVSSGGTRDRHIAPREPAHHRSAFRERMSGNGAGSVPTSLSSYQRSSGFKNPMTRRSYNSTGSVRIDHPSIQYNLENFVNRTPLREDYESPYVKQHIFDSADHLTVHNACWMSAIIDLVNVSMKKTFLTYQKLWEIMGRQGDFDPIQAAEGLTITDMLPVFEYFHRRVVVVDGEGKLVYERQRPKTERKMEHVKPLAWGFVMTEHHVYWCNHCDQVKPWITTRRQREHMRIRATDKQEYELVNVGSREWQFVAPDFPAHELQKPWYISKLDEKPQRKINKTTSKKRRATVAAKPMAVFFDDESVMSRSSIQDVQDSVGMEEKSNERASLSEIIGASRFDGAELIVFTPSQCMMVLVMDFHSVYNFRPTITVNSKGQLTGVFIKSLENRKSISFVSIIQGVCEPSKASFKYVTVEQVKRFFQVKQEFKSKLFKVSSRSFLNESTFEVLSEYTRGGLFCWLEAPEATSDHEKLLSADVGRLYPFILKKAAQTLPKLHFHSRFESVTGDLDSYSQYDLFLACFSHPTLYCDRHVSLCFQTNLLRFSQFEGVGTSVVFHRSFDEYLAANKKDGYIHVGLLGVLRTIQYDSGLDDDIRRVWETPNLPRDLRKMALNMTIGELGKKNNQVGCRGMPRSSLFFNEEETVVYIENNPGCKVHSFEDQFWICQSNNVEGAPRLESGLLLHNLVLDGARSHMHELHSDIVRHGVSIPYIHCDSFYYPEAHRDTVERFYLSEDTDTWGTFGELRHQKKTMQAGLLKDGWRGQLVKGTELFMDEDKIKDIRELIAQHVQDHAKLYTPVPVLAVPDEFHVDNLESFKRLLIRAVVPGAGKTYTVLSRFRPEDCVAVCPTNALCNTLSRAFPGIYTTTYHRFLKVSVGNRANVSNVVVENEDGVDPFEVDEGGDDAGGGSDRPKCMMSFRTNRGYITEKNKVLLLDEIFMASFNLLDKLAFRVRRSQARMIYATGDPNQLPPIDIMNEKSTDTDMVLREHENAINYLFPHQLTLRQCKRGSSTEENNHMEMLSRQALSMSPFSAYGFCAAHLTAIPEETALGFMRNSPENYFSICYLNKTCSRIAESSIGSKTNIGTRLINRKRLENGRTKIMQVNAEVTITAPTEDGLHLVVTEDDVVHGEVEFIVPISHVEKHMHWENTRTCHSVQGASCDKIPILWDVSHPHLSRNWLYVALTRARTPSRLFYVLPETRSDNEMEDDGEDDGLVHYDD